MKPVKKDMAKIPVNATINFILVTIFLESILPAQKLPMGTADILEAP
jgi:hypothetical protein